MWAKIGRKAERLKLKENEESKNQITNLKNKGPDYKSRPVPQNYSSSNT
jgi:hypothetical protein